MKDLINLFNDLSIKKKLYLTTLFVILPLLIVIVFWFTTNSEISSLKKTTDDVSFMTSKIRLFKTNSKDYFLGNINFDSLDADHDELVNVLKNKNNIVDNTIKLILDSTWNTLVKIENIENGIRKIKSEIMELTDNSIKQSGGFITIMSKRLANPKQAKSVSWLERAVIAGANINSEANFKIKVLFLNLMNDIQKKDDLLNFLKISVKNAKNDIQRLKETKYVGMAKQALKSNTKIMSLTKKYINDVENKMQLEKSVQNHLNIIEEKLNLLDNTSKNNVFVSIKRNIITMIILILLLSIVAVIINVFVSRLIVNSITDTVKIMDDIANGEGDLTVRLPVKGKDEMGLLAKNFNLFVEKIRNIIKNIADNALTLSSGSEELATISNQLLSNSEEMTTQSNTVSSTTEEMSTNINTMASAAEEMSVNANNVASASEQMSQNMNSVSGAVEEMSVSINNITKNSEEAKNISGKAIDMSKSASITMDDLGKGASEIGKVTDVIKRIAEQTNLLALNATIEAASAGEAGKGFAVVANEIKELANQSAKAAEDISSRIEGMQNNSENAIKVIKDVSEIINKINESIKGITVSVEQQNQASRDISSNVSEASTGTKNIATSIAEVAKGAKDMSKSSGEAAKGAKDVAVNINGVTKASADTNKAAQQVSKSATDFSEMSGKLKKMIEQFKI